MLFSAAANIIVSPNIVLQSAATYSTTTGYTPTQIRNAYGFNSVQFSTASGTIAGLGQGQTIAIVDAYNDPNIVHDLSVFDATYGLANPPSLKIVNQNGGSKLPATNAGWAGEIALDVQWAHAIAPAANILLVEASSATLGSLLAGVNYARNAVGVSVVSMSWGSSEFIGETQYDSLFTTPAGHQGVTFVAASGDSGVFSGPQWPAVSPNVLSVGGTSLNLQNASGTYGSESAWIGSTGGTSQLEPVPSYQAGLPSADTQSASFNWFSGFSVSSNRSAPDVSYNADPNTGFAVYDSVPYQGYSGWQVVGGTSAGAPQWGALIAIANQGRALNGLGSLNGAGQTLPALYAQYANPGTAGYSTYASTFHDITSGGTPFGSATAGYDQLTGLGSPQAVQVVSALTAGTVSGLAKVVTSPTKSTSVKPAVHRQDVLLPEVLPTLAPASQEFPAMPVVAASPLQVWAALENHFSLADTAPSVLAAASNFAAGFPTLAGSAPGGLSQIANLNFAGVSPVNAAATSVSGSALAGIGQWPASAIENLIGGDSAAVEAFPSAAVMSAIAHITGSDMAAKVATIFSGEPLAGLLPPMHGDSPSSMLGLPPAIFVRHSDGDTRAWEIAAAAGLGATVVGCWYLSIARRQAEAAEQATSRLRQVRDGWELTPMEER